jgi:hypothetical protein
MYDKRKLIVILAGLKALASGCWHGEELVLDMLTHSGTIPEPTEEELEDLHDELNFGYLKLVPGSGPHL